VENILMPQFGQKSKKNLSSCHPKLKKVFNEVIKTVDCSVLEGHRSKDRQNALYKEGKTKVTYPKGRHNSFPSLAVDVAPYPIDWGDRERFTLFAGFVIGIAKSMGIKLRWGGNWDMWEENGRWEVDDNKFDDFPHFELRE
jgi:hypothetical protein